MSLSKYFIKEFINKYDYEDENLDNLVEDGIDEDDEWISVDENGEILDEAKIRSSNIRMTKRKKLNVLGGKAAMSIARKKKKAQYAKYKRLRAKAMRLKNKLKKQFGKKGVRAAKKRYR